MNKILIDKLSKELEKNNIFFKKNFDLSKISWIKASGIAVLIIYPKTSFEVKNIIKLLKDFMLSFIPLGCMSNCIFRDGLIYTPLISSKYLKKIIHNEYEITVGSGVTISSLEKYLMKNNFTLYPGMTGIPATIGGAIFMNAGSYGDTISDKLVSVNIVDTQGENKNLKIEDLEFGWRSSSFQKENNIMITSAKFRINILNDKSKKIYSQSNLHRNKYQECKNPNLGSLFSTKDIYKDVFKQSKTGQIFYLLLRIIKKIISLFGFDSDYIHAYISRKLLLYFLNIYNFNDYISDKTANCLINKKKISADKIIKFVKCYEKKAKLNLEVIIYSDVK